MSAGARAHFYAGSTVEGTSAQHLAAYAELSYKRSHFISTTPWEGGREGVSVPLYRGGSQGSERSLTCSGLEHALPPPHPRPMHRHLGRGE